MDDSTALELVTSLVRFGDSDASDQIAWNLIYFALFRERQFPGLPAFDSAAIRRELTAACRAGDERLRARLAYHLGRLIETGEVTADEVSDWLGAIAGSAPGRTLTVLFYQTSAIVARTNPKLACALVLEFLRKQIESLRANNIEYLGSSVTSPPRSICFAALMDAQTGRGKSTGS